MTQTQASVFDISDQQYEFCIEYLKCHCNATRAAIAAGYSEKSAAQQAWDLLRNPKIREAINGLLVNAGYAPEFVKRRLDSFARATPDQFEPWLHGDIITDENGEQREIRLSDLRKRGVDTSCIKSASLSYTKSGQPVRRIILHDALRATEILARCHGMFAEESDSETPAPSREMVRRVVIEEYEAAGDEIASGVPGIPALTLQRATGGPPRGGNGKDHHGGNGDSPHA